MVQLASFVTPAEYLGKQAALQALCTRAADFDSDFVLHCPDDKEIHNCLKLDSAGLTTFVVVKQSIHPIRGCLRACIHGNVRPPVPLFKPKYRLGHPKNCLFLLCFRPHHVCCRQAKHTSDSWLPARLHPRQRASTSACFLAEILVRSPQKMFIFII